MSSASTVAPTQGRTYTVCVAGNPNSGKTTLFNALTGSTQKVGNYPGVTVEKKEGRRRHAGDTYHLVDLPGTYSLNTFSLDEVVARNYILDEQPDIIVDVLDASNLERNLYLAIQLAEIGKPMVLALNMHDVATQRGIHIEAEALSRALGVPVVPTVGHRKESAEALLTAVAEVASGSRASSPTPIRYDARVEAAVEKLLARMRDDARIGEHAENRWLAVKLLEQDEKVCERIGRLAAQPEILFELVRESAREVEDELDEDLPMLIAEQRYARASELIGGVVTREEARETITDKLDRLVCHRLFGLVAVGIVVYVTFALTFKLADGWAYIPWPGGWETPVGVAAWFFEDFLVSLFSWLPSGPLRSLVVDGVVAGVGGVMGFVPIIFFMFLLLAIIEDSGYVARIAFVLDRMLRAFGLQGKSILALIVSGGIAGGCAVPGVMATRTLNDPRDRLTTMLVVPFMNCGAKIPVFAMLIAAFFAAHKGLMMWVLMVLAWTVALLAALTLRKSLIRGAESPFVMELPAYHMPTVGSVLRNALARSWSYMRKAGTVILAVCIVMWALMYFPRTDLSPYEARQEALAAELADATADLSYAEVLQGDELASTLEHLEAAMTAYVESDQTFFETADTTMSPDQAKIIEAAMYARAGIIDLMTERGADDILAGAKYIPQANRDAAAQLWTYIDATAELENEAAGVQLRNSIAGRIGRTLEPVSRFAGFDWRDNIALTGGFAAKEVIISTMGTAYSMGQVEPLESVEENVASNPLARRISRDPTWSPLRAFALMIFVMVYSPCLVTTSVIFRESGSLKWTLFSTVYTTALAFGLAVLVYQVGMWLGIGVN